jgi:hypothetical protein
VNAGIHPIVKGEQIEMFPGHKPFVPAGGKKNDNGKDRWDLLPWDAVREVVKILVFGATKYNDRNWEKGIVFSRVWAAILRHGTSWWEGEEADPETGRSHVAHMVTNALFLLAFILRGRKDLDDRPVAKAAA